MRYQLVNGTYQLGTSGNSFAGRGSVGGSVRFSTTPLGSGMELYQGAQTTRDGVRGEVGTAGAIGSLYLSTAGKLYLKIANAGATTDWQKVTATAAD